MTKSKITVINTGGTFNKRYNPLSRELIVKTIKDCKNQNIIIVHGTDTMDLTAKYLDEKIKDKTIVLTGAMLPISINKVEATLNFSQAIGFLNSNCENGIYISMKGSIKKYKKLIKNRELGKFLEK